MKIRVEQGMSGMGRGERKRGDGKRKKTLNTVISYTSE
jgi:hypothetical protein